MIIQTAEPGKPFFAMTMDEHTNLAAQFASAFGNRSFEPVKPREIMLYVIENHDKGWQEFDADPKTDPRTGLPYNLVDTPAEIITGTSAASPNYNARHHPYCGLISSMHSWGLYNGRYGMSDLVLIDTIAPEKRHFADRMLDAELSRQRTLKSQMAQDPETAQWCEDRHLFQNYKQLQFFDTLALYFNRTHEGARGTMHFKHVPLDETTDVTVTISPVGTGVYAMSPFPFSGDPATFAFSGRYIEPLSENDDQGWRSRLASAPTQMQQVRIVGA